MCVGEYTASLASICGGAVPSASSESSLSRWATLDDLERRSIVEYMTMESLGGTGRGSEGSHRHDEDFIRAVHAREDDIKRDGPQC